MVFPRKPKKQKEELKANLESNDNQDVSKKDLNDDTKEIDEFLKGNEYNGTKLEIEEIKDQIKPTSEKQEKLKEIDKDIDPETVNLIAKILKNSQKIENTKTFIKATACKKEDGCLYIGFSTENMTQEQTDAIISLLGEELLINHYKRSLTSIQEIKKNG